MKRLGRVRSGDEDAGLLIVLSLHGYKSGLETLYTLKGVGYYASSLGLRSERQKSGGRKATFEDLKDYLHRQAKVVINRFSCIP